MPSTYSMAKISPEYVTATEAIPNKARNTKYISKDSTKNNARPMDS